MRVTNNMMSSNSIYYLQQSTSKLNQLGELTATGNNINQPSDDPINSRVLLDIGDQLNAGTQYASNITKANTFLQVTSTALQGMSDTMSQITQLADTLASGTSDPTTKQSAVTQLQNLKQTLVDMGNTQSGSQYVFGGSVTSTPAFTNSTIGPPATPATFNGDDTPLTVDIGQSTKQQINISGNQVLMGSSTAIPPTTPYGTTNILQSVDNLISAVQSNNVAGIQTATAALENGTNQVANAQSDVASRMIRLTNATTLNTNTTNTLQTIAGNIQNVDYNKLGVELSQQQTAYQASLAATAKISSMSLLNYIAMT